jgi:dethiobiotin synthetase
VSVLVVTGTDTGVGKTVATAALAVVLSRIGRNVCVVKPVQTGVAPDDQGDCGEVRRLAGVPTYELTRFADPLAPMAAARAARVLPPPVADHAGAVLALTRSFDAVIVEGAGGLLVPFDGEGRTVADLMLQLQPAIAVSAVVVARAGLGTLNHTALTVEALQHRGLPCAGLVVGCWPADPDMAMLHNVADLPTVTGRPIVATIPSGAGSLPPDDFREAAQTWFRPEAVATW